MNKKVGIIIGAVILAIIVAIIAIFALRGKTEPNNDAPNVDNNPSQNLVEQEKNNENTENTDDLPKAPTIIMDNITPIEIDETPVTEDPPVVDWEEPPVVTIYNKDADTNSDGHVDKSEWESWIDKHPEDLNQDLQITDDEVDAYESDDESTRLSIKPTTIDDLTQQAEENADKENDDGRQMFEDAGMGLAGIKDGTTANTGNSELDAIFNGTTPDLSKRPGATQDENGNWTIPDMNVQ